MDREAFVEGLKNQFAEEIEEVYLECVHQGSAKKVDVPGLKAKISNLRSSARLQGLSVDDFNELVCSSIPDLADQLDARPEKKSA